MEKAGKLEELLTPKDQKEVRERRKKILAEIIAKMRGEKLKADMERYKPDGD
jgi:hypothetical protein